MKMSCNRRSSSPSLGNWPWFWRAQLPPLPNPVDPRPSTQSVQQLLDASWRVQHSPPDGPSEIPSFSTVAHGGVEILRQFSSPNSRNNERTCLRSGRAKTILTPFQSSTEVDGFLLHVIIFSISIASYSYSFNNCLFCHIKSSCELVHNKSSSCTPEKNCLESHVEACLDE